MTCPDRHHQSGPGPRARRRRRLAAAGAGLVLLAGLLTAAPLAARTIAVPEQYATITAAMAAAAPGDIILVGCGTYREHDIPVRPGVNLWSGTLQPDCVTIDAGGLGRVLVFEPGDASASVVGLTLRGGRSDGDGGAILCRDAAPRLSRCHIEDSHARRGGGLFCGGTAAPVLEDCVFSANTALLHGGAIAWDTDAVGHLRRGSLTGNQALSGGGLAVLRGSGLVVDGMTISGNAAGGSGGGVWVADAAPELRGCLIVGNHGGLGGGALAIRDGSPRLVSCTVADNAAESDGGGLLIRGATPLIDRTIVAFNRDGAVSIRGGGQPVITQSNLFGHPGGDWVTTLDGQGRRHGNFSADPRFCDRTTGRYDLRAGSPCLPGGRPGGEELVGALDRGCP